MRDRGLKRFCSGQEGKTLAYRHMARLADAAMDKIGQIPKGRRNGFDIRRKCPWKQNHSSRRAFPHDLFAISAPRPSLGKRLTIWPNAALPPARTRVF